MHEAYPGHHWHFARLAADAAQGGARPLRFVFGSTYFVEGWGLYAEELLREEGFFRTPEQELCQRDFRLFRAARIIVDTSLHLGEMTIEEAVDFMSTKSSLSRETAQAEVLRYCAWPTQASSYLTGCAGDRPDAAAVDRRGRAAPCATSTTAPPARDGCRSGWWSARCSADRRRVGSSAVTPGDAGAAGTRSTCWCAGSTRTCRCPTYAHPGDAGADLVAAEDVELGPGERAMVPTGVAIALPDGYAAFVHPRSGLAARFGVSIVNAPGTVDAGYRGEIKVLLVNHDPRTTVRLSRGATASRSWSSSASSGPASTRSSCSRGPRGVRVDTGPPAASPPERRTSRRAPCTRRDRGVSVFRRRRARQDEPTRPSRPTTPSRLRTRRRTTAPVPRTWPRLEAGAPSVPAAPPGRENGPWDVSEVDDPASGGRVDLGGMWLPGRPGLEVRIEADQATSQVVAVTLVLADSALQVQPFAAPRTEGIWDEVRGEIRAGITKQGGTSDEVEGPLGTELRTKVPVRAQDGSTGVQPARFLGVDGPRWFLRGVITGRAAVEDGADEQLVEVLRDVVVVRGEEAMAPRDPIPLELPATPAAAERRGRTRADDGGDRGAVGRGPQAVRARTGDHRDPLTSRRHPASWAVRWRHGSVDRGSCAGRSTGWRARPRSTRPPSCTRTAPRSARPRSAELPDRERVARRGHPAHRHAAPACRRAGAGGGALRRQRLDLAGLAGPPADPRHRAGPGDRLLRPGHPRRRAPP